MTKQEYDEAADIQDAINGDVGARLRVEVLTPWTDLLKDEFGKLCDKIGKEKPNKEARQKLVFDFYDYCMVTMAAQILAMAKLISNSPISEAFAQQMLYDKLGEALKGLALRGAFNNLMDVLNKLLVEPTLDKSQPKPKPKKGKKEK